MSEEFKVINKTENDSYIMNDADGNLVLSYNKDHNNLYCGNKATDEQIEAFLKFLSKKRIISVTLIKKGKPDELRLIAELKKQRKPRSDKGKKRIKN